MLCAVLSTGEERTVGGSGEFCACILFWVRPGRRAGESHNELKRQWTETDCVDRHDPDRPHAINGRGERANSSGIFSQYVH